MEWQKVVKTRALYIADDLEEEGIGEEVLVCMPLWTWYVARNFLITYGQRRTSFSMDKRTNLYLLPNDDEFDIISAYISKALGASVMCVQDIVNAIEGVSQAIESQGGCEPCGGSGGSGGSGNVDSPPTVNVDDGMNDPTGGLYPSYPDYRDTKCGVANQIVDNVLDDLQTVSNSIEATWIVSTLVLAFYTPIPFDDIVAIVGIGLTYAISGTISAFAISISNSIVANRDAIICGLSAAGDVSSARSEFLTNSGLSGIDLSFLGYFLSSDSLNRLFTLQTNNGASYPPCDCQCDLCGIEVITGTYLGSGMYQSSLTASNRQTIGLMVNVVGSDDCLSVCGGQGAIQFTNIVGHVDPAGTDAFQTLVESPDCDNLNEVNYGSAQWPSGTLARKFYLVGDKDHQFTMSTSACVFPS